MSKKIIIILSSIGFILALLIITISLVFLNKKDVNIKIADYEDNHKTILLDENSIPTHVLLSDENIKVENENDALKVIEQLKDMYKIDEVSDHLKLLSTQKNDNNTYYKFKQIYKGKEVYNNQLIVSVDKNNNVHSVNGHFYPGLDILTYKKLSKEEIENKLFAGKNKETYKIQSIDDYIYI